MKSVLLAVVAALAQTIASAQSDRPATPDRFDGAWIVGIDCPSDTEDSAAKGYRYEFPATVRHGVLAGAQGQEGAAGSLRIEGEIAADGSAELRARGRTANPDYAAKHPTPGTAYAYRIAARFEGDRGTGTRLDTRVCSFAFRKR